jgi:hypothetical protein
MNKKTTFQCRVIVQFEVDDPDNISDSSLAALKRLEKIYEIICVRHLEQIAAAVNKGKMSEDKI